MTNEDAKVFLDNLKICINEHPVVADWLVEIANRKTEPSGYNLSPVDKDINVRSKIEPLTCRNKDHYADCEYKDNCNPVVCFKALDEFREMVTEPQERSE